MPRVLRRTPGSRKEAIYGYKDLLRDSIAYISRRAGENVERMTSGKMSNEEILEMALGGVGGLVKIPPFKNTTAALEFAEVASKRIVPLLREGLKKQEALTMGAKAKYMKTQNYDELDQAIKYASSRQFYREALEKMGEKVEEFSMGPFR